MDPLSIAGTVLSITGACVTAAKALNDLRGRYNLVSFTLGSICSETTAISASLAQIQHAVLQNSGTLADILDRKPELANTMDNALIGCSVVFAALNQELEKLEADLARAARAGWKVKAKALWKEDQMKEMLSQLRGQQTALSLLLQALQMLVTVRNSRTDS